MAVQMTTRAERQRIARLLDQVHSAADAWVQATYAWGSRDGRGVHSAHVTRQRDLAERRFRDVAAKLVAAVTPPDDAGVRRRAMSRENNPGRYRRLRRHRPGRHWRSYTDEPLRVLG